MKPYYTTKAVFTPGISEEKETFKIAIAKALNPNNRGGRVAKGTKVYDYTNQAFFSMSHTECTRLFYSFDAILKGTYSNPDPKTEEKYKSNFTIKHYREDKSLNMLSINRVENNGAIYINISIISKGVVFTFTMDVNAAYSFKSLIWWAVYIFPGEIALQKGRIYKKKKEETSDNNSYTERSDNSEHQEEVPEYDVMSDPF